MKQPDERCPNCNGILLFIKLVEDVRKVPIFKCVACDRFLVKSDNR